MSTYAARLSEDRRKILLQATYNADTLEFIHTLPNARWDKQSRTWACDFTPISAYRISRLPEFDILCPDLAQVAQNVAYGILEGSTHNPTQPAIRHKDSWSHQCLGYWKAYNAYCTLLGMEMGTGKSKVAVDLVVNWGCTATLVLCPKSVMGVWRREFEKWAPGKFMVTVLDGNGTVATRTDEARRTHEALASVPHVIVINYDSAKMEPFATWATSQRWDCVIADEAHRAKGHNTAVSKFCGKVGRVARRRLALTGTPLTHSPLDAFGIGRFLDPGLFGTGWIHFSNRYALKNNPHVPQMVTGFKNLDELQQRLGLVTYQCRAADVLDLPPVQHHDRHTEMSKLARRIYNDLETELIAEIEHGVVTAKNALVKLIRLQQVTSGFVQPDENDRIEELDTAKADLLTDLLEDMSGHPVVVFCRFRHDLDAVQRVAEQLKLSYGELSGRRRDGLTELSEMNPKIQVLGAQIQSGGVGIDLTRASYGIYYSMCWSLGDYDQSVARLHRPGQTRPVSFYHLICPGTVDQRVYAALSAKREIVDAVLEGLRNHGV